MTPTLSLNGGSVPLPPRTASGPTALDQGGAGGGEGPHSPSTMLRHTHHGPPEVRPPGRQRPDRPPGRSARRPGRLRTLYPLALLVLVAAPAKEARAQWTVVDPLHIAKSVWNGYKILDQLKTQQAQLLAFRDNLERLASYNLRDVTGFVSAVDATLVAGSNVAYSSSSLVSDFDSFYRGADVTATAATTDAWLDDELDAALGTLRSIREHAVQIQAAQADLSAFHGQITTANTSQRIAEVQGTVQAYGVQESQLLRQAALLQIDQEARAQAATAARRAYVIDVGRQAAAQAAANASGMGGVDYNATGIF